MTLTGTQADCCRQAGRQTAGLAGEACSSTGLTFRACLRLYCPAAWFLSAVCAVRLVRPAAGIAMNAVLLTFSTAASLLFAVKTRIIQVTDRFADTVRTGAAGAAAPAAHAGCPVTACEDIGTAQLGLAADQHSAQGQATSHHGSGQRCRRAL